MKSLYAILVTILLLSCSEATPPTQTSTMAGPTPAQDQAAIQQLVQDVFDNIWSGTDTAQVRRYQTEDFLILEHGEVWTNDTIRTWQLGQLANKPADAPKRLNSFEFFRNEIIGDHAWCAYQNNAHWVDAKGDTVNNFSWLESGVAVRTESGWKLKMMHSTRMGR
jgi:PBP1b-binding outer membrane lipoprotein LpoB